jgi:hypothetical protein
MVGKARLFPRGEEGGGRWGRVEVTSRPQALANLPPPGWTRSTKRGEAVKRSRRFRGRGSVPPRGYAGVDKEPKTGQRREEKQKKRRKR